MKGNADVGTRNAEFGTGSTEWVTVRLGDVVKIDRVGVDPETVPPDCSYVGLEHVDSDGTIKPIGTVSDFNLKSTKFRFDERHILFGKLRPYLRKTARSNFNGICSTDILPLLPTDSVDRNFLFHWLRTDAVVLKATQSCSGANLPRLSPELLRAFEFRVPRSLAAQQRVAAILDAADALRAKRRAALAQLDALAQSLFLDLFGDPVTNPMGWAQVELGDLVADNDRINYGVVQPGEEHPGGKPLIRVGDFVGGELDLSGIKFIDPKIDAQYERSRLLGTELLVSCVGSIGTVCRVPLAAKGHNIARAVARVPLGPKVERDFILFCLRSAGVQNYFTSETRTVSQPTLNIGLIKTATVTLPPLPLQQSFAAAIESIEKQKARHREHLAGLDALFASLQHRAFRGEL